MKHLKLFEEFKSDSSQPQLKKQVLLDGTSSSGKSAALKELTKDWGVLAFDSFTNLCAEALGLEDFGNSDKPKITEIYPDCPIELVGPIGGKQFEDAVRWYMAKEAQEGKIYQENLRDVGGRRVGRSPEQDNIVYDDVEETVIEFGKDGGKKPKWILVHAPIDHLISNVRRRPKDDQRAIDSVLKGYSYKFEAKPTRGGVDPDNAWTREDLLKLLQSADDLLLKAHRGSVPETWAEDFLDVMGIVGDKKYWIYPKKSPDVVVNTRQTDGDQKTLSQVAAEVKEAF
jgi:hypothetical protein